MWTRLTAVAAALGLFCSGLGQDQAARAAAPQEPTFRVAIDRIPVEVQVLDRLGQPLPGLTADQFEVTINGRRRPVVSASFITLGAAGPAPGGAMSAATAALLNSPDREADAPLTPPRIFMLAVDTASFDEATGRPILRAAQEFVRKLAPTAEVGLFAYPIGPKVDPTTDHDAVIRSLDTVIAHRETAPAGRFNLSPADLVDLSFGIGVMDARNRQLLTRLCPNWEDPADSCEVELEAQVRGSVLFYEGVAHASISTLDRLMAELGRVPERKTVVLVSGGVLSGDMPGTRPDNHLLGIEAGRTAARANVSVYSLFVDQMWLKTNAAESARALSSQTGLRDSSITGKWLDELAGGSGGSFIKLTAGNGAPAFDRVLRETSAYYLLGVEPAASERDGRPYEMRVRVKVPGAAVQGRSWVIIPKPGETLARAGSPARTFSVPPAAPTPAAPPTPILPPPTPEVQALAAAFDRGDEAAMARALAPRNADTIIESFRRNESPWPARPRWTATFALEMALTGLRTDSPYTRDASLRLLAEYAVRVRQAAASDRFECTWFWLATAGLEGLFAPDAGSVITERGAERCPNDPNLKLGLAVVLDQQLTMGRTAPALRRTVAAGAMTEAERRVLAAYAAAAEVPATRYEARVRAAYLHLRVGRYADGLALYDGLGQPGTDLDLVYIGNLIRSQLLVSVDRIDDAILAVRAALAVRPSAQSGRVALMNLHVRRGEHDQAEALARTIWAAGPGDRDPWWQYFLGDFRAYPSIRAELRGLAK